MRRKEVIIRKAKISDAATIHRLIQPYAKEDLMLPRSPVEIYENIRDYFVAEMNKTLIGCCALHICWKDLAEVKSLAVKPKHTRDGIGSLLVKRALEEAININIKRVFCLTYIPKFFRKFGFRKIGKERLPHKIWNECINCPKFPDCDEVSMLKYLK